MKKNLSLTVTELIIASGYTTPQSLSCRGIEYVIKYVGWIGRGKYGEFVLFSLSRKTKCWRPLGRFGHRFEGSSVLEC